MSSACGSLHFPCATAYQTAVQNCIVNMFMRRIREDILNKKYLTLAMDRLTDKLRIDSYLYVLEVLIEYYCKLKCGKLKQRIFDVINMCSDIFVNPHPEHQPFHHLVADTSAHLDIGLVSVFMDANSELGCRYADTEYGRVTPLHILLMHNVPNYEAVCVILEKCPRSAR